MAPLDSLKAEMKRRGISMRGLAESVGKSLAYVNGIVNGHMQPSPDVAARILGAVKPTEKVKVALYLQWSARDRAQTRAWWGLVDVPDTAPRYVMDDAGLILDGFKQVPVVQSAVNTVQSGDEEFSEYGI